MPCGAWLCILDGVGEYFEGAHNRLNGGNSDNGGLANVNWNNADNRNDNWSPRPLGVTKGAHVGAFTFLIQPPTILPIS